MEAGRSWRSWQHYCTVIVQPHPVFFSNIRHPVGTKAGTDMKVWQITQCSKSVCLEKQKWLWAYYCKCPAFYISFIFFYFFPSPALNVFCVCCVILMVNTPPETLLTTSLHTIYNNIKGLNLKLLAGEVNSADRTARVQHSAGNPPYPGVHLDAD